MPKKKTLSMGNYQFIRDRRGPELEWYRVEDIKKDTFPRSVVLVNGAFDMLHASHMRLLFAARDKAGPKGTVVCALDGDSKISENKGVGRPIQTFVERATALQYMPIDAVVEVTSEGDMRNLIQRLRPDLRVQGVEYKTTVSRYPWLKKAYIRDGANHTTDLRKRCYESYMKEIEYQKDYDE